MGGTYDIRKIIQEKEIKRNVSNKMICELSKSNNVSIRTIESDMLKHNILPYRYSRNIKTLSIEDQQLLSRAKVAVVGCGGLGGYIVEELTRIGVGYLTIMDGDSFEETNLNRQIGSMTDTLGKPKAQVLKERMGKVNGAVEVKAINEKLTVENAVDFLSAHDVVVDALDNVEGRMIVQNACSTLGIPFIHGAIGGWYIQVTTIYPGDNTLEKLYKDQQKGIEKDLGNPSFTPPLAASIQVAEAIKLLTKKGEILKNKVLFGDLLNMEFTIIEM